MRSGAFTDVLELARLEQRRWRSVDRKLREGGDPTALLGGFAGLEANPNPTALAAVTGVIVETAAYTTSTFAPIAANPQMPKLLRFFMALTITTGVTPGTLTFTPRIGTTTAGITLGASAAITLTASITSALLLVRGDVLLRVPGSGTAATAYGDFKAEGKVVTAGAGALDVNHIFGGTVAAFDSTAASGLFMGLTPSNAGTSITPQIVALGSWN